MDFFARQERSRRATQHLVLLFALAFLAVALATTIVVGLIFQFLPAFDTPLLSTNVGARLESPRSWLALGGVMTSVISLMAIASTYRAATLSKGGARVARMLGGTEIHGDATDPLHRRLINVVEEMSIASGVPVPDIFVLEAEPGINAFAAGLSQADAAVAVTRGTLERLNRSELQGVIAHEFSHVLNGDMRLNQRLIGLSFGILVLSLIGRWLLRSAHFNTARSRNNNGSVAVALGIALAAIGAIGVFFSRLIKAAVSRQREVLADASAVQFTREPEALAGALKKIGGYTAAFSATDSEEVAHMLFGSGSASFRGWFATHPPLPERIRALDPTFDESQFEAAAGPLPPHMNTSADENVRGIAAAQFDPHSTQSPIERAGSIESANVGSTLRNSIPATLCDAAHSHELSFLLTLAMSCSTQEHDTLRQNHFLEQQLGGQRAGLCKKFQEELGELDTRLRLPLLELCIPALRQRPNEQIQFLFSLVSTLSQLRHTYELFDFVLPHVLDAYLGERAEARLTQTAHRRNRLNTNTILNDLAAAVASFGHDSSELATAAYQAGLTATSNQHVTNLHGSIRPEDSTYLPMLDQAVRILATQHQQIKRMALQAVYAAITYDKVIRAEELEIFRAIAAALQVPTPPLGIGKLKALGPAAAVG